MAKLPSSSYPELSTASLLDIAVLQITAAVKTTPPIFSGVGPIKITKEDSELLEDMFYLQTSTSKAPEALEVGSEVALYGYSLGHAKQGGLDHLRIAAGTAAVTQLVAGFALVDATAVAASGLSGGPLLNQSGEIVGIMSHDYNSEYLKRKHLTGTTNLSWFRRLSEILEGHGMPPEEDMLPTAYAVRIHGKHKCGVWEQINLQIETQRVALDNIVEASRNTQIESKRAELHKIEHELIVLQVDGGFAVDEQIKNATVESPGKLGMYARIRDQLRALEFGASQDPAPPLAPPLTDVDGSGAQYNKPIEAAEEQIIQEDEALKNDLLEILDSTASTDERVRKARRHIRAENFTEAHSILQNSLEASKTSASNLSAQSLAHTKLLLVYTKYTLGVVAKEDQDFMAAADWLSGLGPKHSTEEREDRRRQA
jgi:hypothetical protein